MQYNNKDYWSNISRSLEIEDDWYTVGANNPFFIYYRYLIDNAIKSLDLDVKGKKLLDIGCGLGVWSIYFANKGAEVTGADISKEMLEKSSKHIKKLDKKNISLKLLDIVANETEEKYDIIFLATVLQHIYSNKLFKKAIKNIGNSLKKGGKVVIVETAPSQLLSPILQELANIAKSKKDCSYRSLKNYKRTFSSERMEIIKWEGIDISYPLSYSYYSIMFSLSKIRKNNWVEFFYNKNKKPSLLETTIFKTSSKIDKLANFKGLRELSLLKVIIFEKK